MLKHSFVLWLLANGHLQTKDRLPYVPCNTCPLCQGKNDSGAPLLPLLGQPGISMCVLGWASARDEHDETDVTKSSKEKSKARDVSRR